MAGGSYLAQRDRRVLFGLGAVTAVTALHVRWPDGSNKVYRDLAVDRYHQIRFSN